MSVPKIAPTTAVTESDPTGLEVDALIIGVVQGTDGPELAPGTEGVADAFDGDLAGLLGMLGASGRLDEVVKLPTRGAMAPKMLVAAGVGKPGADGKIGAEQVRRAAGAAARTLFGTSSAATTLSILDLAAATEGLLLGGYSYREYKSTNGSTNGTGVADHTAPLGHLHLVTAGTGAAQDTVDRSAAIATAVANARDLVNTPPNDLYPAAFAERAAALGKAAGLEVEILDETALAEGGYGGILGVGGGSSRQPRLVRLRYNGGEGAKKVALVGKGITFDTGGISLKPAPNMDNMTSDMAGAAAVVATVALAAALKLPLEVTATVPMAENMPSGAAYRPGDVLRMYGGKTVEVLNTDAEGRLILADAMVRACEDGPDYLIDTATLTGAQVVALGTRTAGVMGTDEFRDRVAEHAQQTGEGGWAMPLPAELREGIDSKLADLANVSGTRWGGMLTAGIFLREFVAEGVQWAHVDVAGPAYNTDAPWGYTGKGATGVPVRTLAALLTDIAANG